MKRSSGISYKSVWRTLLMIFGARSPVWPLICLLCILSIVGKQGCAEAKCGHGVGNYSLDQLAFNFNISSGPRRIIDINFWVSWDEHLNSSEICKFQTPNTANFFTKIKKNWGKWVFTIFWKVRNQLIDRRRFFSKRLHRETGHLVWKRTFIY